MTIDSSWVKLLKTCEASAFSDTLQSYPEAVFIDGQIKLMKAEYIDTWNLFLEKQFVIPIQRHFNQGARVVVLAFDNYAHVPVSKAPTQRKRNIQKRTYQFETGSSLPKNMPENWNEAMRHRGFKVEVIKMVLEYFTRNFCEIIDASTQSVVLDFEGAPIVLGKKIDFPTTFPTTSKRGECDIKAFNYNWFRDILLDSTDGDYIPMALLQTNACLELKDDDMAESSRPKTNMYVRRIKIRVDKKRKAGETKREFEYVNIQTLGKFLKQEFKKSPSAAMDFALMCSISGCDFTVRLPILGPLRLWQRRHTWTLQETEKAGACVEHIFRYAILNYMGYFKKHHQMSYKEVEKETSRDTLSAKYDRMVNQIRKSNVSGVILNKLWSSSRLLAHCKNVAWTCAYWTQLDQYPDPLEITEEGNESVWGFVTQKKGVVFENNNA